MRLFIAIELSGPLRDLVQDIQRDCRRQGVDGSFSPRENLHLTLAFIGEHPDPGAVLEAMEGVSFEPFEITMDRTGRFDGVWWAGFSKSAALEALARRLRRSLAAAGVPFDAKKFRAHVTFLRRPVTAREDVLPELELSPRSMTVDRIVLMRSDRGKRGMIYTVIGAAEAGR